MELGGRGGPDGCFILRSEGSGQVGKLSAIHKLFRGSRCRTDTRTLKDRNRNEKILATRAGARGSSKESAVMFHFASTSMKFTVSPPLLSSHPKPHHRTLM